MTGTAGYRRGLLCRLPNRKSQRHSVMKTAILCFSSVIQHARMDQNPSTFWMIQTLERMLFKNLKSSVFSVHV